MFKLISLFTLVFCGSVFAATPVACKVRSINTTNSSFVCRDATPTDTTYVLVKGSKVSVNGAPISSTNTLNVGDGCHVLVTTAPNVDGAKCQR